MEKHEQKDHVHVAAGSSLCPVCDCPEVELLSPSWKKYHNEKEFFFAEREWFASCESCATIFRYPLLDYADYKKYGEDYYDQVNPGETVEEHAEWHFKAFQKPNYDALRQYLNHVAPPDTSKKWLDVGSIGYATTFDEYDFTTIEPDARIVALGRRLFGPGIYSRLLGKKARIYSNTIENFGLEKAFDGIVFNNSFYCLPFPLAGLKKAFDLLRPDGDLIITISTFFADATAVRTDGKLSRIEDVLQGETLWVFYNQKSLEYLAQRAGFKLMGTEEVHCYGKKTMRAFHFRKAASVTENKALLAESKACMQDKLTSLFADFSRQTADALEIHNKPDVFVIGTLSVLNGISAHSALQNIAGFVLFNTPIISGKVNGINCIGIDELFRLVRSSPKKYTLIIASFKFQDEIHALINSLSAELALLLKPNRKSGMESLEFLFSGQIRPCKGLTLENA